MHPIALLAAFVLTRPVAPAPETVLVTFQATSSWSTGFQGEIVLTNQASYTIYDWKLTFDFSHSISSIWNGSVAAHSGSKYVLSAAQATWEDGDLSPGESVAIGFIASPSPPTLPIQIDLNGAPVVLGVPSPAPPPLTPNAAPQWPERVLAPYIDATAWPPFDFVAAAQQQGQRWFSLGFIVAKPGTAGNPEPSWGGYYSISSQYLLPELNALRELGGDAVVSFGGAAGTELAAAATSVASLQAAYQAVIDAYALRRVDFDIEGAWLADAPSVARRSQAIAGLQSAAAAAGRPLDVTFTLPVLPTGLTAAGVALLDSALAAGVDIRCVNIMAMDYGDSAAPNPSGQMGSYAIAAATSTFLQVSSVYAAHGKVLSSDAAWRKVGVTPMIGVNDVQTEVFTLADAAQLLGFANTQHLGMLSFWSANRDQPCPGGALGVVLSTCSGIAQPSFGFTQILRSYTTGTWRDLGQAKPGALGLPQLTGSGDLLPGASYTIALSNGQPLQPLYLLVGAAASNLSILDVVLVPSLDALYNGMTGPAGSVAASGIWPAGLPTGASFFYQCILADPTAPFGFTVSNALQASAP